MVVLNGIKNFLEFVNQNWTMIAVILGLLVMVVKKFNTWLELGDDEKIEIAKSQIIETILKLVSDAEEDYDEWNKAGAVKRSQVIQQIFDNYPVLELVVDQKELIAWIDTQIDSALVELRKVIANQ